MTGNEDGAESRIRETASETVEVAFAAPPLAWAYRSTGPEYPDPDHGKGEWPSTTARALRRIPVPAG